MKRLIAISISFLMLTPLLGMGGGQAIVIKHKAAASGFSVVKVNTTCGATGNFASPVTCTITNPTASGHSLLAFLAISNGSALSSCTPACTVIPTPAAPNGNELAGYIIPNVSTSLTSVVFTYGSNFTQSSIAIVEVAGIVTTSIIDTSVGVTGTTYGAGSKNTGSVTTANANDVIISYIGANASGDIGLPGTGYITLFPSTAYSTNTTTFVGAQYKVVSATGTYNPGYTQNNNGGDNVGTAALKLQ